ncbi:AAA [Hondaea fermentalgiana]|uniref:AAA n=1 Tax=Hondaea fermentalgiana TaxID=2315210 RepID=A0A2R5GYV9_9STRA|nr:AAA [Hondaea fermentalgiana]|eukprot:GBG33923.1 AAA [Hondaea fermentalgiana]
MSAVRAVAEQVHGHIWNQTGHKVDSGAVLALLSKDLQNQIKKIYSNKPVAKLRENFPDLFLREGKHLRALAPPSASAEGTPSVNTTNKSRPTFANVAKEDAAWHLRIRSEANMQQDDSIVDESLRRMLPLEVLTFVENVLDPEARARLRDISLDVGRPSHCWIAGPSHRERVDILQEGTTEPLVTTPEMLSHILRDIPPPGHDNRTGPADGLHRVSVLRNIAGEVYGATIRVARVMIGSAMILQDILDGQDSVLIVGPPGSGKTTLIRDMARRLAETRSVFVVDTSNEIGGNTDGSALEALGYARRAMVATRDEQQHVMIEVLQNHSPDVMVIDEIGRSREVEAAATTRERAVRLIASAHGSSLESLLANRQLAGLIGGVTSLTLGDMEARNWQKKRGTSHLTKVVRQRRNKAIFDSIVFLDPRPNAPMQIVHNVSQAIDNLLDGMPYEIELRHMLPAGERFDPQQLTSLPILAPDVDEIDDHDRVLGVKLSSEHFSNTGIKFI